MYAPVPVLGEFKVVVACVVLYRSHARIAPGAVDQCGAMPPAARRVLTGRAVVVEQHGVFSQTLNRFTNTADQPVCFRPPLRLVALPAVSGEAEVPIEVVQKIKEFVPSHGSIVPAPSLPSE